MTKKGLTLIELLGVIIVLGIIATISFPAINGVINNTRRDAIAQNANTFVDAAVSYAKIEFLRSLNFNALTGPTGIDTNLTIEGNRNTSSEIVVDVAYLQSIGYLEGKFPGEKGNTITLIIIDQNIEVSDVTYTENNWTLGNGLTTGNYDHIKRQHIVPVNNR